MNHKPSTINCLLIANRGEISSRISRTCKKMGIRSVAVYSDADRNAPFVKDADIAIHIGESRPAQSYLDQDKIINAAKKLNADAIHPGYGFLSENYEFAKRCKKEGIIFVGPNPEAILKMGSKSEAKAIMTAHDVPVVPGYQGADQSEEKLKTEAIKIGFPLLLKAAAGGGGKGMRIVHKANHLEQAIQAAKRESKSAFGNDELIIEKYIESGRHIEFQIFGDRHGNAIHLFERECSIQRRYQKIIEESPSPVMNEVLFENMSQAAINAAKALIYDNAGTVEFIYDDKNKEFFFLEVNTRLQVEHPVTEEITGIDLVQLQIECAQGQPLSLSQSDVIARGYAIEVRLYAEDPNNNFIPVTGKINRLEFPKVEGLRIESAIESGSEISIYYDPMIAKIIMWSDDRQSAIRKMNYALRHMICQGTTTNLNLLVDITEDQNFITGKYNTHFISFFEGYDDSRDNKDGVLIAASLNHWNKRQNQNRLLKGLPSGWRNSFYIPQSDIFEIGDKEYEVKYRMLASHFEFTINDREHQVKFLSGNQQRLLLEIDGMIQQYSISEDEKTLFLHNEAIGNIVVHRKDRFPIRSAEQGASGYKTPMPAQIVKILVNEGDKVHSGDPLIIISSMKMESTIEANEDGTIEEIFINEGENVEADVELLKIKRQ